MKVLSTLQLGKCGSPQVGSGLSAQEQLEEWLEKHGYKLSKVTHGFWEHDIRPISFSLVVDDFIVKYAGQEHADHLIGVLKKNYDVSPDN